jgi:peptide chain release factor 3
VPRFAPEHFAHLHATNTAQGKRFDAGVAHLLQEGVLQRFTTATESRRAPLLAAVGPLQFEVFRYRLSAEYGADSRIEEAAWRVVRWLDAESYALAKAEYLTGKTTLAFDPDGHAVILFEKEWDCEYFANKYPKIRLSRRPPSAVQPK